MSRNGRYDNLLNLLKGSQQAYWCKFCNRHIKPIQGDKGLVFVHDQVPHPTDYVYDSGDEHVVM